MKRLILIISTITLFFVGCEKTEEYSEIPFIKYYDFNFDKEIINGFENQIGFLQFDFVDGNGDIGFAENSDTITDIEIPDVF
ncbi:MAG: hypothetical protein KAQ75_01590, partial [Bacteroidales bacterium]|nr:hypothetical protein [Bacteroidales bacterium]